MANSHQLQATVTQTVIPVLESCDPLVQELICFVFQYSQQYPDAGRLDLLVAITQNFHHRIPPEKQDTVLNQTMAFFNTVKQIQ